MSGWREPLPTLVRAAAEETLVVTELYDRLPLDAWSSGRITLLGDAAHPMAPFLGQGANMALEDAVFLASSLAEHPEPADALRAYERERMPRTSRVTMVSAGIGSAGERPAERPAVDFRAFLGWLYSYPAVPVAGGRRA
jgi:2-polyprenyl-6-methoxyphenol hydroxylase-like FAD-dependent oxidoreductase